MILTKVLGVSSGILLLTTVAMGAMISNKNDRIETMDRFIVSVQSATQIASGNPKLARDDVPLQIQRLGTALSGAKRTLENQSESIDRQADETKKYRAEAQRQAVLREEVIRKSTELAHRLQNDALTPVDRVNLEAELRRVQDLAYEGNL